MTESDGNISVGEDRLRAILAEFKLELIQEFEKYATKEALSSLEKVVHAVEGRVRSLELWQATLGGVDKTRRAFSDRSLALTSLIVALVGSVATIIWLTHG